MADYYCRYCDRFVREDDAEEKISSILHPEVDTRSTEWFKFLACPGCGYELMERANECVCGSLKHEDEVLCDWCEEFAKANWSKCIEALAKDVKCDIYDAEEIMDIFFEHK